VAKCIVYLVLLLPVRLLGSIQTKDVEFKSLDEMIDTYNIYI